MKKEQFYIDLFGCTLLVKAEIEQPSSGTHETPSDNGSIEITAILCGNSDIKELVEQIPNSDELIIDEIRKQL